MAFAQAWNHGIEEVEVRAPGLAAIDIERIRSFHRRVYHPGNLVLVVLGGFEPGRARELVERHLGGLAGGERPADVDWSSVPRISRVVWDTDTRAYCVAYEPPADRFEKNFLSLWASLWWSRDLRGDQELARHAVMTFSSQWTWPVDLLPMFVYAALQPRADLAEVRRILDERLARARGDSSLVTAVRKMAPHLLSPMPFDWDQVRGQAKGLGARMKMPEDRAAGLVLGNLALQIGQRELFLGSEGPAFLDWLSKLTEAEASAILERSLAPERRLEIQLVPRRK
jgi:hypothetical protein